MARRTADPTPSVAPPELVWQKAAYRFHSFAYRDPRSAFASGIALPVVSPTTVLLGVVSSLFYLGDADNAQQLLKILHFCETMVDTPDGIIFFRAFHQLRRYETLKYDKANPRFGMTKINQGSREYGLVDGVMTLYVGVPTEYAVPVEKALVNLRHLGTNDSLCSLDYPVERCSKPEADTVIYAPNAEFAQNSSGNLTSLITDGVTVVTLSRFVKERRVDQTLPHWKMTGGADTEMVPHVIRGLFEGTSRGKIYRKRKSGNR